jgi:hypothetical protein
LIFPDFLRCGVGFIGGGLEGGSGNVKRIELGRCSFSVGIFTDGFISSGGFGAFPNFILRRIAPPPAAFAVD